VLKREVRCDWQEMRTGMWDSHKGNTHLIIILANKTMKTLKKNYEFKNVLSRGKYYSGKNIEVFIKKNNNNYNRIGIAISSKIAKATKRNKIKRLIRENYRIIENNIKTGYDMVFLWKKKVDIENANYYNMQRDIEIITKKSELIKENWWRQY